ncbi:ribonuclease Z [Geothermobacter hydrogeniphilus]|uniref:Ribonuclease Z n=1 Tax=Geothermobacter hydrogeniphilus TaxID=1969733 RepID=A0A2K2HA52_9BACT|nr:MBL fold metallo-hydrolase [Geothermobacter hydrogeniphilus]PNU20195.1 ribonuclease Z [Geothermobacter hydrogeniphilus]
MTLRLPFRNLQPNFCSGLFDDPLLLIRQRPLGSNLLFDCGRLQHLAKRALTAIEAVFVSHGHMDHWMGIDTLTRHVYVTPKTVELFGPVGIAAKLESKLAGYDWNLCEQNWGSYQVHEIGSETIRSHLLSGPDGFRRTELGSRPRSSRVIFENHLLRVAAEPCDHLVDSLIFRIDEQPIFIIDEAFLERHQLLKGPWIRQLKRRFHRWEDLDLPLTALRRGVDGAEEFRIEDVRGFCREIAAEQRPASIGYISDIGWSAANREKITGLLSGVTLLLCETTFLSDAVERARSSRHLCSADVNRLLEQLRPEFFLPMHLSKSYNRCSSRLYRELQIPSGTTLLRIPDLVTPRPLLQSEFPWQEYRASGPVE